MHRGRRLLFVAALVVLCAVLTIASVPDAHGWAQLQLRSLQVRVALTPHFGLRLRSVDLHEWVLRDQVGSSLRLNLSGGLSEADLCQAMLALDKATPSKRQMLTVMIVQPDEDMIFESLSWDRESGRLEHLVGGDIPYSDSVNTLFPVGAIPSGVDRAMLQQFAEGESIEWR